MNVTGLARPLNAFAEPFDFSFGGVRQFAVQAFLQAVCYTAAIDMCHAIVNGAGQGAWLLAWPIAVRVRS